MPKFLFIADTRPLSQTHEIPYRRAFAAPLTYLAPPEDSNCEQASHAQ